MSRSVYLLALACALAACQETTTPFAPASSPAFSLVPVDAIAATDLGFTGTAVGVNDLGVAVGVIRVGNDAHAFVWTTADGLRDLGAPGVNSVARDINNLGDVVGGNPCCSFALGQPNNPRAALWKADGTVLNLGTFGGDESFATAINDLGEVVGEARLSDSPTISHAFRWTAGEGLQDLGTLGGDFSSASDINNLEQIVGASRTTAGSTLPIHAYVWTRGEGMRDIGTLGGQNSGAVAINDLGQVVGTSETADGGVHVFLWDPVGGMRDLGISANAVDINDLGQVVLEMFDDRPFVWSQDDGLRLLTPFPGDVQSTARAINNLGLVAGASANDELDTQRAVLWTTLRDATPGEETRVLSDAVQDLVRSGAITAGQGNPLLSALAVISRQLDRGKCKSAKALFDSFAKQVHAYVTAGILTPAEAQPLLSSVENAVDQLAC